MNVGSVNNLDVARRYLAELAIQQQRGERWRFIPKKGFYTSVPLTTGTMGVVNDSLAIWRNLLPVKYRIGGVSFYGQIGNATTGNNAVSIYGPPLGGEIESLWIGQPELVQRHNLHIPGVYGNVAGDLHNATGQSIRWYGPRAYLVRAVLSHITDQTGGTTNPTTGVYVGEGVGGSAAFSSDVVVSTAPQAQSVAVAPQYEMQGGAYLSLRNSVLDDGVASHAANLNATLIFVLE